MPVKSILLRWNTDNYAEVPNTENTDNITLTCDYSRDVNASDVVNVKWLDSNQVISPGVVDNLNMSIQVTLNIIQS